jgi:predicted amidohydrolase
MKIGIAHIAHSTNLIFDRQRITDAANRAYRKDVDLLCFCEWFIGFKSMVDIPNQFTAQLSYIARKTGMTIVSGNMLISSSLKVNKITSVVINDLGEVEGSQDKIRLYKEEVGWVVPAQALEPIRTKYGDLCILSGLTALDVDAHKRAKDLGADMVVLQYSFKSFEERDEVQDMLLPLSEMAVPLMIVAPFMGTLNKANYLAPGFIIRSGKLIAQGGNGGELIVGEVEIERKFGPIKVSQVQTSQQPRRLWRRPAWYY